ncbi:MAG: DNA (cytosine-5-)-methyltransferase, partial [Dolichospermum sp.]
MMKFIDLFCGTGGFRIAVEMICHQYNIYSQCVFSSDIDIDSQKIYTANFGETPAGDITKINENDIPEHDILLAGFPCQPFSICGELKGFADTRGTLFFDIARIIQAKKPTAFILENVKQLQGHQQGKTLKIIIDNLQDLGYYTDYKIVNALNFGLPQKRERILIIGFKNQH